MLRILFEWFEFPFECFKSLLNGFNVHSNASNPFRIVRIPFEWFEFPFECFEYLSNGFNVHSNASSASNFFRIVLI